MRFEEFASEIEWWGDEKDGFKARRQTERAWQVSIDAIKARNYNLDIKNPHVAEQVNHDPEKLLADYQQQQVEIQSLRDQLKAILSDALIGSSK